MTQGKTQPNSISPETFTAWMVFDGGGFPKIGTLSYTRLEAIAKRIAEVRGVWNWEQRKKHGDRCKKVTISSTATRCR